MLSKNHTLVNNLIYNKDNSCKGVYISDTRSPMIGENRVRDIFSFGGKITFHMRLYCVQKEDQEG